MERFNVQSTQYVQTKIKVQRADTKSKERVQNPRPKYNICMYKDNGAKNTVQKYEAQSTRYKVHEHKIHNGMKYSYEGVIHF